MAAELQPDHRGRRARVRPGAADGAGPRARREGWDGAVNSDDLLLRLNLCALYASRASDLRFLDALNYYYELLPAGWQPRGRNPWLLASYLALYARPGDVG